VFSSFSLKKLFPSSAQSLIVVAGLSALTLSSSALLASQQALVVDPQVIKQQNIARLNLKSVLYSQHQGAFLDAITEVLVAEKKQIWRHLPGQNNASEVETADSEVSKDQWLPQDLKLIEASLYQFFGMENEAERIFLEAVKKKASHLPTAYLLLAKYYYEQQDWQQSISWLKKIDNAQLSSQQFNVKQYFLIDSYIHAGDLKKARAELSVLSNAMSEFASELSDQDYQWQHIATFNLEGRKASLPKRTYTKQGENASQAEANVELSSASQLTLDDALQRELAAFYSLRDGMESVRKDYWPQAVNAFASVPADAMVSVEAQRWLAWSLMKSERFEEASLMWRSLTALPASQSLDAHIMSAASVEAYGNKPKALGWFERSMVFYSEQLEVLETVEAQISQGEWLNNLSSNNFGWSPKHVVIDSEQIDQQVTFYPWIEKRWQNPDFQQKLSDYQGLSEMAELLEAKSAYMGVFDLMVQNRREGFEKIQRKVNQMSLDESVKQQQALLAQHQSKLEQVADYKDVISIGDLKQLQDQARLERVEANIASLKAMGGYAQKINLAPYEKRFENLKRIHFWEMNESYPTNFRSYQREIRLLEEGIGETKTALKQMRSAEKDAPKWFVGFDQTITQLTSKVTQAQQQATQLQAQLKQSLNDDLISDIAARKALCQRYLEQSILAAARLRDEMAYELTMKVSPSKGRAN
jgi:flagellar hook-basal body complex protein FliE